jgi:ADP-ribose pyrophosphatase YjhB (NUDIX family)
MMTPEENRHDDAQPRPGEQHLPGGPKVRVSGLLIDHGRVLLVRQTHGSRDHWLLPGGAVERGETLSVALEREVLEECGLRVHVENGPIALVQTISPDGGKTRHLIQLIFEARPVVTSEGNVTAPPHVEATDPVVKERGWFAPAEIESLDIHPPIHDLLVSWLRFRETNQSAKIQFVSGGPIWADE